MDRAQVLEQIEPLAGGKPITMDFTPATRVAFSREEEAATVRAGRGRTITVPKGLIPTLMDYAGVPKLMAARLRPDTLAHVTGELLQRQESATFLLDKDNLVTEIAPRGAYHPVEPERALAAVERGIGGEAKYQRVLELKQHTVRLEMLGLDEHTVTVPGSHQRMNDLVKAGVLVQFSPVGFTNPLIQSFAVRQVCANGLVMQDVLKEFTFPTGGGRRGDGDDVWQWFRQSSKDAYDGIGRVVERFNQLAATNVPPEQRAMIITALLKEAGLRGDVAQAVQARALDTPPQNEWDVFNLITWATSHVAEDPNVIVRAQNAGARFVSENEHRRTCPTCGTQR